MIHTIESLLFSSRLNYIDASSLLKYCLGVEHNYLIINRNLPVDSETVKKFQHLVELRITGKPLAKIVGVKEFWSKDFIVNTQVLDPRPDSEALIEAAMQLFPNRHSKLDIAELGVGSGCLIINLLNIYKAARGIGFELSAGALCIARINQKKFNLNRRLSVFYGHWGGCKGSFDLIISNPPYLKNFDLNKSIGLKKFEPTLALAGGAVGIEKYLQIIRIISRNLRIGGYALLEIGHDQFHLVKRLLSAFSGIKYVGYRTDLAQIKRVIIFKRS